MKITRHGRWQVEDFTRHNEQPEAFESAANKSKELGRPVGVTPPSYEVDMEFFEGLASTAIVVSDTFPPYVAAPALTTYVSGGAFNNTYIISTTGNDTTGTGTELNPWATINGARTGGAGTAAAPGDLILFRGGTYTATTFQLGWKDGAYYFDIAGNSTDRIVFSVYPSETATFESAGKGYPSLHIKSDYIVFDSLNFTTGTVIVNHYSGAGSADYFVLQNCTFDGIPYDPFNDQPYGHHFTISEKAQNAIIRNNLFKGAANASTDGIAISNFNGGAYPSVSNVQVLYNRFVDNYQWYGCVNHKGSIYNWEFAYNRFENVSCPIGLGPHYPSAGGDPHDIYNIHHNAFDGVEKNLVAGLRGAVLSVGGTSAWTDANNINLYSNLMINSAGGAAFLLRSCGSGSTCNTGGTDLGDVYDNAMLGSINAIDPHNTTNFDLYPGYWNYNMYESTANRDTAENQNALASSLWQGNALIQAAHGITRTGTVGNRFYTIENTNGMIGAGRYGGNIGGFAFG